MGPRSPRTRVALPALLAAALSLAAMSAGPGQSAASGPSPEETHAVIVTGAPAPVGHARAQLSGAAGFDDLPIVGGFAADLTDDQADLLEAAGLHVSDNAPVTVSDADWGADSHEASAIYPRVDGATDAWAAGLDGRGVGVAVIDTGISNTDDLSGKVVGGYDFSAEGSHTTDSFGHGTFVAGIIAGSGAASDGAVKGVAPGAHLVSVKVADANGASDVIRVISGIQWVVNHRLLYNIRVLNLSLGTDSTQNWRIDPLNAAVEGAWRAGIVVTVAAGNAGAAGISKPGDDPYVITVGSTDDATTVDAGDDTVAPFSSTGPTAAGIQKPDLVAPGRHLVSMRAPGSAADTTFPGSRVGPIYFRGSGTSFSAPQVAGAAALLLQQRPLLTPNQVKGLLTGSASGLPGAPATAQGAGMLDVDAALETWTAPAANQGLARSDGSGSPFKSEGSLSDAGGPTRDGVAWNSAAWNSAAWNSAAWNSAAWNSAAWNSAAWNSAAWNSAAWNSAAWNADGWASTGFWSVSWD